MNGPKQNVVKAEGSTHKESSRQTLHSAVEVDVPQEFQFAVVSPKEEGGGQRKNEDGKVAVNYGDSLQLIPEGSK